METKYKLPGREPDEDYDYDATFTVINLLNAIRRMKKVTLRELTRTLGDEAFRVDGMAGIMPLSNSLYYLKLDFGFNYLD